MKKLNPIFCYFHKENNGDKKVTSFEFRFRKNSFRSENINQETRKEIVNWLNECMDRKDCARCLIIPTPSIFFQSVMKDAENLIELQLIKLLDFYTLVNEHNIDLTEYNLDDDDVPCGEIVERMMKDINEIIEFIPSDDDKPFLVKQIKPSFEKILISDLR
jgi:hypothetical protein